MTTIIQIKLLEIILLRWSIRSFCSKVQETLNTLELLSNVQMAGIALSMREEEELLDLQGLPRNHQAQRTK